MNTLRPFHLAFPVTNLVGTRKWYTEILGCEVGRESEDWIDFNLFGHQIVAHLVDNSVDNSSNIVDGKKIPSFHFGVILEWYEWQNFSEMLIDKNIEFIVEPHIRFKGKPGEQATMFFEDPSGNNLEFKAFHSDNLIFAKSL